MQVWQQKSSVPVLFLLLRLRASLGVSNLRPVVLLKPVTLARCQIPEISRGAWLARNPQLPQEKDEWS